MADSMCGPSNALQNFQKHSTVDRTLQQDRLVSRQSPSQGFRSSPGPNGHLLNPEFEAFQAGHLPLDQGFQNHGASLSHAPQNFQQAGPSWATDFQRMNISTPPPQLHQQSFGAQAQQRLDTGDWHQEFARQQAGMLEQSNMGQVSNQGHDFQSMNRSMGMGMNAHFGGQFMGGHEGQQAFNQTQQHQSNEAFDEEAFARAFDEAAQRELESTHAEQNVGAEQDQNLGVGQDVMLNESAERLLAEDVPPVLDEADTRPKDQGLIGADQIHDPNKPASEQKPDDPDALARTAGRLLNSVRHDQSNKFANSQFLELMRQFRDREAVVEGDKIVDTMVAEGHTNRDMNNISNMEYEKVQQALVHLSRDLKIMLLDRDRPFVRTPSNVRTLLMKLLSIDQLFASYLSTQTPRPLDSRMITRTLQNIVSLPVLAQLPSVKKQVAYLLAMFANNNSASLQLASSASESGSGTGAGFVFQSLRAVESRLSAAEIDPIAAANAEISAIAMEGSKDGYEEPEMREMDKPDAIEGSLARVLGYEFLSRPHGESREVHEERARDILGGLKR